MKVKVLRSLGREWPDLIEGQVADVKDHVADQLIAKKLAIRLDDPPPQIKGTPPAIADETSDEGDQPVAEEARQPAPKRSAKRTSRKS